MASFYILVERRNQRKDSTYPIAIKVRWNSAEKGHTPTKLYATKKQVVEDVE